MLDSYIEVKKSGPLVGIVEVAGAKNAVLVIMASLLLVDGKSVLHNVPASADVWFMKMLLEEIGAVVVFDVLNHTLTVDTSTINCWRVNYAIMQKMRASILLMGPLLARFGNADVAFPGGCVLGARPIDYHIKNLEKMGVVFDKAGDFLHAKVTGQKMHGARLVLEYPSVGATENLLMAAVMADGVVTIINAALEPEVMDLITVLKKMGAGIDIYPPATVVVHGNAVLRPIEHTIIPDRLEAGSLLLAAAITGGDITVVGVSQGMLDLLLLKLSEMGHTVMVGLDDSSIRLKAINNPCAVSFKTGPFPCFPTDLQAPMMVAQVLATGTSMIEETIFENRLGHVNPLIKMGASISLVNNATAVTNGVLSLQGQEVEASDIRASCALVLAGLVATGTTRIGGVHHWKRGYELLDQKLCSLGASIRIIDNSSIVSSVDQIHVKQT